MRTKRMRFSLRNTQSLHLMSNLLLQVVIRVAIRLLALWMARLFFHQLTRKLLDFSFSVLLCLSYTLSIFFCLCRYILISSVVMFSHGFGKCFSFVDEDLLTQVMFTSSGRGVTCIFVQVLFTFRKTSFVGVSTISRRVALSLTTFFWKTHHVNV
jgi:hypothetical protein